MEKKGMTVRLRLGERFGKDKEQVLKNITEIHYKYPTGMPSPRVAFESDIDSTGTTWDLSDVEEFEAIMEYKG